LSQWKPRNANPLILIAESPEKPGNIGALLRTADAAGIDAVWIANPNTDLYNPNVIRSSVGCLFTTQTLIGSNAEMITFLQNNKYQILTAALQDNAVNYLNVDYTVPTAIIVGTESTGLSEEWLHATHQSIIIPMRGTIDSMNVSVAAAVLVFEAVRQRTK
jgi:TrmH family RNA methyltransferase